MLSFMRDQQAEDLVGAGLASSTDPASPSHNENMEFLSVSGRKKNVQRSTLYVITLFGVGVVCLLLMVKKSKPAAAGAAENVEEEARIEVAISRLTGARSEMVDSMDHIVNKFYEFSNVPQVGVNELNKNPFQQDSYIKDQQTIAEDNAQERRINSLRQKMLHDSEDISLLSIMHSEEENRCMINELFLSVNDRVGNFIVTDIGDKSVDLQWQPEELDISDMPPEQTKIKLTLSE